MPGKRTASIAAALITLTSVIPGGEHSTPGEAGQDTFVEILSSPSGPERGQEPLPVNGGCNFDPPT